MARDVVSKIYERVREKKETYHRYNFERSQEEAFATFFDLAQEYTSIDSLFEISVVVPKEFLGLDSSFYFIETKRCRLELVCTSEEGLIEPEDRVESKKPLSDGPYETESSTVFPIRGNRALTKLIPYLCQSHILGLFEVRPKERVDAKIHFFLEKFTNRIGYNLHQKMLIEQNINHIKFINQLVSDIEHNVISPNLYYKFFLRQLRRYLDGYHDAARRLNEAILLLQGRGEDIVNPLARIHQDIESNNRELESSYKALSSHYEHTSLFLETLFRREHFQRGSYVLRKQSCNFRTEIIQPLLERYMPAFEKRDITVDNRLDNIPDEQITLYVDKGLISQVFDNLFSNAVKYTETVVDQMGNEIKLVSYNRQIIKDCFGENKPGVRFNFFTTGRPLPEDEAKKLFQEGFRASTARQERGTGHGLHFVKNVVEIHGGKVGCEPQQCGNNIYFILPLK